MKFGIFDQNDRGAGPLAQQYEDRLRLAEFYDRNGFHCLHISEHHATPLSTAPAPGVFLSAVAQRTRRLLLGPLVYLLPVHNPLRLAEEICMLDQLSHGRFQLGIGRGASPHELAFLGAVPEDAQAMYEEALLIIRKALTADVLTHHGRFWQFTDVPMEIRPFQLPHPPLWYAVSGPDSVGWPAANGVNVVCAGPPARVRETTDAYRVAARAAGRAPSPDLCLGMMRFIVVGRTDGEAMSLGRRAWPAFHRHFWQLWRARGSQPRTLRLPEAFEELVQSGAAIAGSPATVFDRLSDQVAAAGVNYLIGSLVFGTMEHAEALGSIERFAGEVMPRFAGVSASISVSTGGQAAPRHEHHAG